MRSDQFGQFVEERVTILTEGERIEGLLVYAGQTRISDFLNSATQQEAKFLRCKEPRVYCRRTGEELVRPHFLMVARDRIVMLMTHAPAEPDDPLAGPPRHELSGRYRG